MRIVFLGTGTSQGIPVVGCDCPVCSSNDPRDKRLRSSVMFIKEGFHLLIDMSPDLRQQLLNNKLQNIDAIFITHEHNDHVSGVDDVRPINFKWKKSIPIYTSSRVIEELETRFYYAFQENYAARPRLSLHPIIPFETYDIGPFRIQTLRVMHGGLEILGLLIDGVAYLTDAKYLPDRTKELLKETELIILSALHKRTHYSHLNLEEALALLQELQPQRALLTHVAHGMGRFAEASRLLPGTVDFAYDGLSVSIT